VIIPGVGSSPESTLESIISLDFTGRPRPSLTFLSLGPGVGAGVDVLDTGPADFDAGPGVLDTGPPAGGRDDFLFSPGFAGAGDGAEAAVAAAAAFGVLAGPVRKG